MINEKIKAFVKDAYSRDDEDALFGFFYKNIDGREELRINSGDWMCDEIADFIEDWCDENNINVEFEAEVSDEYFIKQGFKQIK